MRLSTTQELPDGVTLEAEALYRLSVPTPFAIGPVNAYLIEGDPLTLMDGGPNLGTSLHAIERMLTGLGHQVDDLELLVITHHHADHEGLTGTLAERSGAEVAALGVAADFIADYTLRRAAEDDFARALMLRHGVEGSIVDGLRSLGRLVTSFGAPAVVTRRLEAGDLIVMGGRRFRVEHRPGHSTTDTVFYEQETGVVITGDHLLSQISSNALVTGPPDGSGRSQPLLDLRRSLSATAKLSTSIGVGGHGPPISDVPKLVERRFMEQRRRADEIKQLLEQGAPMSAHELASKLWGHVAVTQAFLTLSEVLGHVDLLVKEGVATFDDSGEVVLVGFD